MIPGLGIIILILIVVAVVWLIGALGRAGGPSISGYEAGQLNHPGSPMDIVRRRYAQGEITREEFERMRKDLESE